MENFEQKTSYQQQKEQDLYNFIKTKQDYYMKKFSKMENSNNSISWNWCSFIFGAAWFAYRKMYGFAAAYCIISYLTAAIPGIGLYINFLLWILSGILGNYFYKQHTEKHLQAATNLSDYEKSNYIHKKGGTSIGAVFALYAIIFVTIFTFLSVISSF